MPTRVGPKGQVVIEKDIRDRLGIRPGALAIQELVGEKVQIHFLPPPHEQSLYASLADQIRHRPEGMSWDEIRRIAWEKAVLREGAEEIRATSPRPRKGRRRKRRERG